MSSEHTTHILTQTVDELSGKESLNQKSQMSGGNGSSNTTSLKVKGLYHEHRDGDPLPSAKALEEIIELARAIIFPGFYGHSSVKFRTIKYQIGVNIERLHKLLSQQILAGLCFVESEEQSPCREEAVNIATQLISKLPELRRILATDVEAAYNGDPAATGFGEIISCYPVIKALINYRLAHELHLLGVPLIPRMMTEMAHSETGIDIHPAATIGEHFTIDHGTGVVIGATCVIGNNVKLYQGVTLGAISFPLDENGNPMKGIPRHPILEDNVVIYANATILGRITIGKNCVVGANVWVTRNMEPYTRKYNKEKVNRIDIEFNHGMGI